MFDFLKPKSSKKEVLNIDTVEGKGSYGELLNPPKQEVYCITGAVDMSDVSGYRLPNWYRTGFLTLQKEEPEPNLVVCAQCGENAWDGNICHSCGIKNI